jgi:hypothetical protein
MDLLADFYNHWGNSAGTHEVCDGIFLDIRNDRYGCPKCRRTCKHLKNLCKSVRNIGGPIMNDRDQKWDCQQRTKRGYECKAHTHTRDWASTVVDACLFCLVTVLTLVFHFSHFPERGSCRLRELFFLLHLDLCWAFFMFSPVSFPKPCSFSHFQVKEIPHFSI